MYKIDKESFGYKMVFEGLVREPEMQDWVKDSRSALDGAPSSFGVFVDMRALKPLSPEARSVMEQGQKLFKEKGLERSVVVVDSAILAMQFKQIARETGIDQWERYIDASSVPNWEKAGQDWVKSAVDPDA